MGGYPPICHSPDGLLLEALIVVDVLQDLLVLLGIHRLLHQGIPLGVLPLLAFSVLDVPGVEILWLDEMRNFSPQMGVLVDPVGPVLQPWLGWHHLW